jgi:hypothetical protein
MHLKPPGGAEYIYLPRADPLPTQPALGDYSVGWQYTNFNLPPPSEAAAPRTHATDLSGPRHGAERSREHRYEYEYLAQDAMSTPNEPPAAPLPVLLCHVCKDCDQMRSARFHRQHPVVPGKPLVSSSCRRCAKKNKKRKERCVRKSVHVRTCRAEEPCDWPAQDIHIRIRGDSDRNRHHRSRSVGVYYDPPAERPQTMRRSESRTNLGLRVLQGNQVPRALSPRSISPVHVRVREARLEADIHIAEHPMPYRVLPDRRAFLEEAEELAISQHTAPQPLYDHPRPSSSGILKPSGMDRKTLYRHETGMRESRESTMVEVGGPRVQFSTEAERRAARIMLDRNREQSRWHVLDQNSEDYDYFHLREIAYSRTADPQSPPITSFENLHIRSSPLPRGADDEIRVRYVSPRRYEELHIREQSPERRHERARVRHLSPLNAGIREVNTRYKSPSPPRRESHADDCVRHRSLHHSPQRQTSNEIRYRYIPEPRRGRSPQCDPSLERPYASYRTVARRQIVERESSLPTQREAPEKQKDWDQGTATDSDGSGDLMDIRTFRGTDEDGQPVTFVEERRRVRLIEEEKGGSENGGYPQMSTGYEHGKERQRFEQDYEREYALPRAYKDF